MLSVILYVLCLLNVDAYAVYFYAYAAYFIIICMPMTFCSLQDAVDASERELNGIDMRVNVKQSSCVGVRFGPRFGAKCAELSLFWWASVDIWVYWWWCMVVHFGQRTNFSMLFSLCKISRVFRALIVF